MNKTLKRCIILCAFILCPNIIQAEGDQWNEITYADPTVIAEDGKYYLTGTRTPSSEGFAIVESTDLVHWTTPDGSPLQFILAKGADTFGQKGFWAPQYFKDGGKYYFTYTANEQTCLASSESTLGPFTQDTIRPIDDSEKNIDSFLFKDEDGKVYLYHVRFHRGNHLWVAEFDLKKGEIIPGTLKHTLSCTEEWEMTPNYKSDPIMEGPTVMKIEGTYYLFYSCNHFMNIDYAVGYATSNSPYGPWKKHQDNPIIHRNITGENGSGHGDIFKGHDGRYYYVYHIHNSSSTVSPRKTRIVPLNFEKGKDGIFKITAVKEEMIIPKWK